MIKPTLVLVCALLCACADVAEEGSMAEEDTLAMAPAPAGITLADVAGTWQMSVTNELGDTIPPFELVATADPAGWVMHLQDREPMSLTVQAMGDSIVADTPPFESVIREGTQVWTHMAYRMEGDRLVGDGVAHYETTDSDSVVALHSEGTRAP